MNTIKNPTKILNIFIYLFALLTLTKGDIINNPVSIPTDLKNPIKVKESNYYYILSSGKYLILDFTGNKVAEGNFEEYSRPYTWINDESNNKYIFAKDKYINVTFNGETITYKNLTKPNYWNMEYPNSNVYIGSMTETSSGDLESCLHPIEKDEVIIYGKKDNNYLVLTFLKLKWSFQYLMDNMEDKVDCKVVHKGC